jgi:hypothetical protein
MTNVWECFHLATLELVRSTPIKQRLIAAYRRSLSCLTMDQLPGEVRDSFAQIIRTLMGVLPMPGEDAVVASVRKMSIQEADECASQIVEIFGLMSQATPAVGTNRPSTVVQLHSIDRTTGEEFVPALIANH